MADGAKPSDRWLTNSNTLVVAGVTRSSRLDAVVAGSRPVTRRAASSSDSI